MLNVLSLFDGLSGARVALHNLGIKCRYFASEIDEPAIMVSKKNWPDAIRLGDVKYIDINKLPVIDLLIAGFPCQDMSQANASGTGAKIEYKPGLKGAKSSLFFSALDILHKLKPKHFIFENVSSHLSVEVTKHIGREPVKLNSAHFSAQRRSRLFWTNFNVSQPANKSTLCINDILDKGKPAEGTYRPRVTQQIKDTKWIGVSDIKSYQESKVYCTNYKSPCINTRFFPRVAVAPGYYRKLTIQELERLQGLPAGYTAGQYKYHRLKMLGNAFTVPVIEHLIKCMQKKKSPVYLQHSFNFSI